MNRKVQIYIEGERIELFNDEQITVVSTQQNIADISKTYTDFSQSFTVPASPVNNAIFQHFYQSDVNATIDHNIRRNAFIEIDLTFFRRGKIQIESSKITNGKAESYTLTFYGDGKTLLDYFGEDLLSDLDYTLLNHEYTGTEVQARIEDNANTYSVKYPLISSKRIWTWSGQTPTTITPSWLTIPTTSSNNIHSTSGHIDYTELFPAVRVKEIFKAIQTKYGINFYGNFITSDDRFDKLFLWYKNKNEFQIVSQPYLLDILYATPSYSTYDLTSNFDTTTDTLNVFPLTGVLSHLIELQVTSVSTSDTYIIDVYQNGNLLNSIYGSGVGTYTCDFFNQTAGLNVNYQFKIRAVDIMTIDTKIKYSVQYLSAGSIVSDYAISNNNSQFIDLYTDLASMAPAMKISDFFSGICKIFNLTCYGVDDNSYNIEPIDDWYSQGAVVDITKYTDITSIEIDRMKLYKTITMKYQPSDSFLNRQFSQLFSREYGDTTYQYNYDGDEFILDVPFENLLQTRFTGTKLQVGYSLNNEFAPYIPKPILLYQYDNRSVDFHFNNGTSTVNITKYTPFGQDLYTNLTDYTLNFAPDISTMLEQPVQQTLFGTYYFSYLYNMYDLKQRFVKVKTILPISLLTGLQLNDRLIIRDKRYLINSMQSNLVTGEVNLELILDFRPIVNLTQQPYVSVDGGDVFIPIPLINGAVSGDITTTMADVIISPDYIESTQVITVTIPSGSTGTVYPLDITYTLSNGDTITNTINIIQL